MASKNGFETILSKSKPIFAYNPPGLLDISLIKAVDNGIWFG